MNSTMSDTVDNSVLHPVFVVVAYSLSRAERAFSAIPGSDIIVRYIKSSHQNDPFRTLLEVFLVIFAIRTLLKSRTRADRSTTKHFIKFEEKEIDDLVDEWVPEPLVKELDAAGQVQLDSVPVIVGAPGIKPKIQNTGKTVINLASYNFAGLAGNEAVKERAVDILRNYGLGSCGPPGFYGTVDVHMDLEKDIAAFLGTEDSIIYSQGFATVSSVIPAFCKRGDIIIADRGVNFIIHQGLRLSRSTIRWYDHNDLQSLEEAMVSVEKEIKRRKAPLTRRFIVTEGIFENDGAMSDLPKLIELKNKYKYRLLLDESFSFGTVGRTGRGLTELYNVPADQVDLIVGSMANTLCASGGFCAGSQFAVKHQRINGTSFVFSAAMPAMLAATASEGINILIKTPRVLGDLHENVSVLRSALEKLDCITIPSHPASALIHVYVRQPSSSSSPAIAYPQSYDVVAPAGTRTILPSKSNPSQLLPPTYAPAWDRIAEEETLLQDVVDEALAQGVLITKARRLRGQESVEPRPSIKIAASAALSKKDTEKAAAILRAAFTKVLGRR